MSAPKVVLVTDPMCSWCWGMTQDFEAARAEIGSLVEFELMLGGINVHGTQFIGDYGRRFLMKLWREVEATTGQPFGYKLPAQYVHNSVTSCLAVEAVRELSGSVPFAYLARLQQLFFVEGLDITSPQVLAEAAGEFAVEADALQSKMSEPRLLEKVRFQFDHAQSFGTQALPSLLKADDTGVLRLLAGGYVDQPMLISLLTADGMVPAT